MEAKQTSILQTERLILRPSSTALTSAVLAFLQKNKHTQTQFEPLHNAAYFTAEKQQALLAQDSFRAAEGSGFRFWVSHKDAPDEIIGTVALNNVVYGVFQACHVGYRCGVNERGNGYTTEAVRALCTFAFEELHLHRLEANIMPENVASFRVVEKLGFVSEGLAEKYLKINGQWKDHVHMVLLNTHEE